MAWTDSYSSFQAEVQSWLDTPDVTVTSLTTPIELGERYVFRKLRVADMETALAVTMTSAGVATLPADYAEAQYLYLDRSPTQPLTKKSAEWIFRNYPDRASTGIPAFVAETNNTFIFGPQPSTTTDVVKGTYYFKTFMASASTITSLFTAYPEIFLYAALANAENFLGRDERMIWQQRTDQAINEANKEDRRKRFGGSPVASSPG